MAFRTTWHPDYAINPVMGEMRQTVNFAKAKLKEWWLQEDR